MTAEYLRSILDYDCSTGVFTWKVSRHGAKKGSQASYKRVCIDYKRYPAHQLAWLHYYGYWPEKRLTHINGNIADNAISNLRECGRLKEPTVAYLRSILDYDSLTGIFTWKRSRHGAKKGSQAGGFDSKGYKRIRVDYKTYPAQHLAWLHYYGCWPKKRLTHINGNIADNAIANLGEK